MRRFAYGLCFVGLAFGVVAESSARPPLVAFDAAVGGALVLLGCAAWRRGGFRGIGPVMLATGFAWFLGTLWDPALYLHRALIAQLLLAYPRAVPSNRPERAAIAAAFVVAAIAPVGSNDVSTIAFGAGLVSVAGVRWWLADGRERRARAAAFGSAAAFGLVLVLEAAGRIGGIAGQRLELGVYDITVLLVAAALFADTVWGRWTRAALTSLAFELGAPSQALPLRDQLARAISDPALVLAYRLSGAPGYVDEAGRRVDLPGAETGRALTPVIEEGIEIAVLVHDRALLEDPELVTSVAALTQLALSNARLQAETRGRAVELDASRRRILEAADEQRRQLESELREGAGRRLALVERLVADVNPELRSEVAAARTELEAFALGVHPSILTADGLAAALSELARRSPLPVTVDAPSDRFGRALEVAAYFVAAEALTNVAKHAAASRAVVTVRSSAEWLRVEIADDGAGGADASRGSGIRGLADRVEALGGRLSLESKARLGTRIHATLPLHAPSTGVRPSGVHTAS